MWSSLSEQVSSALSDAVVKAAQQAKQGDEKQLWIIHKAFSQPIVPEGSSIFHLARSGEIELLGRHWYDSQALKNCFEVRTTWVIAKSA
jgi:hypothetical protein